VNIINHVLLLGEDIIDELSEERNILSNELGHVHISESTGNDHLFIGSFLFITLVGTSGSEYGQNVTETEIIMSSLRKLLFTKFVEHIEFDRQRLVLGVSYRGKLDLHNDLTVRLHHGDTTEEYFEVLRELLTSSVTGVHSNEVPDVELKETHAFVRELKVLSLDLLGLSDSFDLGSDNRESRKGDTVKFVKASPNTGGT
jgi:hypothetical protein